MSLKPKKSASAIPPLPAGTYTGVCIGVVDLGEQPDTYNKNSKVTKFNSQLLLIFEIAGETVEQDSEQKPRWLSKRLTNTLGKKSNLYKYAKALLGIEPDDNYVAPELAAQACLMSVELKESETEAGLFHNVIENVMPLPRSTTPPDPIGEVLIFDLDKPDLETFDKLPEWIQELITSSPTYVKDAAVNGEKKVVNMDTEEQKFNAAVKAATTAKVNDGLPKAADF